MSVFGPAHPLDVDLADLAEGVLDGPGTALVEAHLTGCLVCRARLGRLRQATPAMLHLDRPLPTLTLPWPSGGGADDPERQPAVDELWLAGGDDLRGGWLLVLVLRAAGDRLSIAPATFDVEAADDETLVVDSSGLGPVAAYPGLATEVPRSVLVERVGRVEGTGVRRGPAIVDDSDPRIEIRQHLADRLRSLGPPAAAADVDVDVAAAADAPADVRSSLIGDLRAFRGRLCSVRPLYDWGDALLAHRAGWHPIAVIDEVGIVLVVFDTPHGLADDTDFDAARAVLTRFNATAVVVLAGTLSDTADTFDSSSLNYGIDAPSGNHSAPRPLISGLAPFDAIAKFLDRSSGTRLAAPPSRGPVTRVDVDDILREAAGEAVAEAVRQAPRFKILPKRRGYESIADAEEGLAAALAHAFGPEPSIVHDLLEL